MSRIPAARGSSSTAKWLLLFATCTVCLLVLCCWMGLQMIRGGWVAEDFTAKDLSSKEVLVKARNQYDMFTPTPDPLVDMTFLPGLEEQSAWKTRVPLSTNSSGFRYPRDFKEKEEGTYRVVLLGDSFIAARGARFEEGPAPQLEGMLTRAILPGKLGQKKIEVYPLGVGGWNIISEISFLIHNLHRIQPDLVIHVLCSNDLDSGYGFLLGHVRSAVYDMQGFFGPSHMSTSSPGMAARASTPIKGLIGSYLIPESRNRFQKAAGEARRLKDLLERRYHAEYLLFVIKDRIALGIQQCFGSFMDGEEIMIGPDAVRQNNLGPLDRHPNQEGYRYMSLALARYLLDHDLLPLDGEALEKEGAYAPYTTLAARRITRAYVEEQFEVREIPAEIRVKDGRIEPENALRCIVGGLFHGAVLSVRTALVLRRTPESEQVRLELAFPSHPALDGGEMVVFINGDRRATADMTATDGEISRVTVPLLEKDKQEDLVEIVLEGNRFFTEPYHEMLNGLYGYAPRCGKLLSAALIP